MFPDVFHKLVIPFLAGFVVTIGKLIADRKLLSLDEANDISLDIVLIALGALGAFYVGYEARVSGIPIDTAKVIEATKAAADTAKQNIFDGGVVDALVGAILLYLRAERRSRTPSSGVAPPVGWLSGITQPILALFAIFWTVRPF